MKLLKLIIHRPIAVGMVYLVIAAVGLNFLSKMPLEEIPTADNPSIVVEAVFNGTNPETMEAFITSPIEAAISTVKGIKSVESSTFEGYSIIRAEFSDKVDMKYVELDIKERLAILEADFPPAVRTFVRPATANNRVLNRNQGQSQALRYTLTGNFRLEWIREYAEEEIQVQLQGLSGVGEVRLVGGRKRLIRIEIDKNKADLFGVNEFAIRQAIATSNIDRNAGFVYRDGTRFDIFIDNELSSVKEISSLLVASRTGNMVFVRDVAMIYDTFDEVQSVSRINGNPVVSVFVDMEETANTVTFVKEVDEMVEKLREDFPVTLQMIRQNNPAQKVEKDIADIKARAVFCILVIFMVLYIFLKNLNVPFLIISTIVFSELTTIILFYTFGISFNLLTIAGLALGFGMLVDSAIVVIDNIFRYREAGEEMYESAIKGTKEVFLPLLASVTTTSIVFIPFLYLDKDLRVAFTPVALAVSLSLLSSMVVAFTFIPTFALKFLPKKKESYQKNIEGNKIVKYLTDSYEKFIVFAVRKKYWTLGTAVLLLASSVGIYNYTVSSFGGFGGGSQRTQISVRVTLPSGAEFDRAEDIAKQFEDRILVSDYVKILYTTIGSQQTSRRSSSLTLRLTVEFTEEGENAGYPFLMYDELTGYASTFARVSIGVQGLGDYFSAGGFGGSGSNFRIKVKGYNFNDVARIADNLARNLEKTPRVKNVNSNQNYFSRGEKFETVIRIKRDKLAAFNVDVAQVIGVIERHVRSSGGASMTKIGGEEINYAVKVKDFEELQVEDLNNVMFTNALGESVRMRDVTEIGTQKVMNQIDRKDQQYERTVGFEYRGPQQMGKNLVDRLKEVTILPKGYEIEDSSGFNFISNRDKVQYWLVTIFAIIMVYMMTSSLYESLLHPLVVILTVPMALIGVFYIFFFAGQSFNRSAYIGVILLAGIVVNNSIILVDHINLLRSRGFDLYKAVIQGCKDRVRPILMTSATTILGMLPLVLFVEDSAKNSFSGSGQSMWYTISLASIGGLLSATPLTLSIIPVLYILIEEWRNKARKQWQSVDQ